MKRIFTLTCLLLPLLLKAQYGYYSVMANATVQKSPASITLNWTTPPAVTGGQIMIYRKLKTATNWSTPIATLNGSTDTYTDNNVASGNAYEYRIQKNDTTQPYGYIFAGIEEEAIHNRGAILLLIDSTFSDSCRPEISTLINDLRGDGWEVLTKTFERTETVANIKNYIVNTYNTNSRLSALYILGHIPVPYSGNLNPDAHNNHIGAWPADVYYGDMDGNWTDNNVNNVSSANPLNHNIPGDGKFDNDYIGSDIELQVGRVDFWDMPAFSASEVQLMRNYLNKAHAYKTGALTVVKRALIDDNFKNMPEGFAGNGWRNFAPMVGIDSVSAKDFISTLNNNFYQWAYGCGGGSYTSCSGIGNTTNIAANDMNAIFTPLFGSYFGDWNYKNNFLRAPLCADEPSLASFWAGRPNWHLHHMALGETIGYATRLTQNNAGIYITPISQMSKMVTIALMGDPTLRTEYLKAPGSITLTPTTGAGAALSWTASTEPGVAGYYVYRADSEFGEYKLRSNIVTDTTFTDSFGTDGTYWYMVRATKLQTTPSGTYYNLSLGIADQGTFQFPFFDVSVTDVQAISEVIVTPNPARDLARLNIKSKKSAEAIISVTDLSGKVLSIEQTKLQAGENVHSLDISKLAAGIYVVHVRSSTGTTTVKLAKTY